MFDIVIDGILVGLILVLFVGPAFFYLIKVSIEKGMIEAIFFAFGIILSDILLIVLIYLGFAAILENELYQKVFSLISGIILIILAIVTFNSSRVPKPVNINIEPDHKVFWYFFQGILINGFNPFTSLIWIGLVGTIGLRETYGPDEFKLFFAGLLCTILLADILKAYLASQLKKLINEKLIQKVNKILALIFLILGLRLLLYFLSLLFSWKGIF